jgi:hypothetical protein
MPHAPGKITARKLSVPGQFQEGSPKRVRSYRNVAIGIAVLVLIIVVIAGVVFFTKSAGTSAGSPDKESGSGLLGLILSGNIPGAPSENAKDPAQPTTIPQKKSAGPGLITNRAVPVVTDTSLEMK